MITSENQPIEKKKRVFTTEQRARKNAYKKEYRAKNKDAIKAWNADYRARNKARKKESDRKYKELNKQKIKEGSALYLFLNRDKRAAYYRKYRHTSSGRATQSANRHIRRARKVAATIVDPRAIYVWEKQWRAAKRVKCYWCNKRVAGNKAHMDHIQPLARGGAHSIENLCISCQPCNSRKHAKPLPEWNRQIAQPALL
jgi:5-methylcytosine-specific restriction endonuclease McrA